MVINNAAEDVNVCNFEGISILTLNGYTTLRRNAKLFRSASLLVGCLSQPQPTVAPARIDPANSHSNRTRATAPERFQDNNKISKEEICFTSVLSFIVFFSAVYHILKPIIGMHK